MKLIKIAHIAYIAKIAPIIILIELGLILFSYSLVQEATRESQQNTPIAPLVRTISLIVTLPVPYIGEAPEHEWVGPWKNACEEASIAMVDKYYEGGRESGTADTVDTKEAMRFMQTLFDEQDTRYGSNANSDATQSALLIEDFTSYHAHIKDNPTIEEIQGELRAGRPVIALHRGFDLKNENIPFLETGSSYHMTVVIGFDEVKKVFLTNDPGDEIDGAGHTYSYETFMGSLHDYRHSTELADGPARVIFTSKKKG